MKSRFTESPEDIVEYGRSVVLTEALALNKVAKHLDSRFADAVRLIMSRAGRVATSGVGKAGAVARKVAATLSSTGTAAYWIHPCEALHGDLGMMAKEDILIAFSKSGEADELVRFLRAVKEGGTRIIGVTCSARSSLARQSEVVLDLGSVEETCPLGLAPSTSTTVMLAVGDALAFAVMKAGGVTAEDYARWHPGGDLGRRLLRIEEIMRRGIEVPAVTGDVSVRQMLAARTRTRGMHRPPGAAVVVDGDGKLVGIFTDGDLRRHLQDGGDFLDRPVAEVMTAGPRCVREGALAVEVMDVMKRHEIDELPIVNDHGKLVGIVDVQDLLAAGLLIKNVPEEEVEE